MQIIYKRNKKDIYLSAYRKKVCFCETQLEHAALCHCQEYKHNIIQNGDTTIRFSTVSSLTSINLAILNNKKCSRQQLMHNTGTTVAQHGHNNNFTTLQIEVINDITAMKPMTTWQSYGEIMAIGII